MGKAVTSCPSSSIVPLSGADQSHDHVEDGGLSGAVRTQQADGLASPNGNADVLNDHPALVPLAEIMDCEQPLPAGSVPSGVVPTPPIRLGPEPTRPTAGGVLAHQVFTHGKALATTSFDGARGPNMRGSYLGFAGSAPLLFGANWPCTRPALPPLVSIVAWPVFRS